METDNNAWQGTLSIQASMNNYLRCKKCDMHDRVPKHVIECAEKRVPRFIILEALVFKEHFSLYVAIQLIYI